MHRTFATVGLVVSCAVALGAQQAAPRPSQAEEGAIIEQSRTALRFDDDGTGTRESYFRIKAQSEAGVKQWGQLVIGYNASTERLEMPLIRVRKPDGTTVDTPPSGIQDLTSPVGRIAPVYTDLHQKHVTVQSFRPGDTLEVRIVATVHTALAPRQFWTEYNFNEDSVVLDETLDIDVPAARHVTLKTRPGYDAKVTEAGGRRVYHWSHSHLAREKKSDEAKRNEPKKAPGQAQWAAVRLTTFADWPEVGRWFAALEQQARIVSPEIKAKAAELTRGRATEIEKLEALYDFVSKDFRYVSLSLGLGRYQPRAATDVLHDAYGDCKDKHTLLATLIDAAGMQASAALINSKFRIDPEFPSPAQFDHVITRAIAGGQVVWLDVTPEVAPFRLLSSNLRGRQALVTDVQPSPRLEETPADPPMPGELATAVDGALDSAGTLSAKVTMTFRGDMELLMRSMFRLLPAARWQDSIERILKQGGFDGKASALQVSDPQATREPFTLQFHLDTASYVDFAKKKLDVEFPLTSGTDSSLRLADTDPISVGGPNRIVYRLTLRLPDGAKPRLPLPITVSRDYGTYQSQYEASGNTLTVVRTLTLTARELPDARRDDLESFLRAARNDGNQKLGIDAAALAGPVASPSPDPPASASSAAEVRRLNQQGYDAVQARDYARAVQLATRVTQLEPKDKDAWNNLGRAFMGLHRVDDAIAAFRTQLAVNPYDPYAYNNLGLAYVAKGAHADAEASFLKQLEVSPLDKFAYPNLGALYITTHAYDKAAAAFEKAIALVPDSAPLYVRLGKAYVNLKQMDKAREAFARAVELAPNPLIWNDVAYELALAGVDLDKAQQYAESAVAAVSAASRNLEAAHADAAAFGVVRSQASYWDTLGWVLFAKGDLASARRYVEAAWKLGEQPEVGDHLGQIYEKLGLKDEATAAYAEAMAAGQPAEEVRQHLSRIAGAGKVDEAIATHRGDLSAARTFVLKEKGPVGKKADFLLLFSAPGHLEDVSFIEGDDAMRQITDGIRQFPAAGVFPDATPARILRRAMASCNAEGACVVTLIPSEDARPVK